ncbi:MAG: hypothetical protein A3K19_22965 [Lentisphaerae bacterium RIFOXYB12_FULL_65_16]|nr:MAG: hypothetical protein A3K18_16790 [Lentisphaerae bacterium RIFOXYA12_64_32]OGV90071.1 MAG: hypothetical protein A3K19_22965 [Lentisphaerae bacterium RIFOXYB12_FULL_65_16]
MNVTAAGLDEAVIASAKRRIETAVVPTMARLYGHGRPTFDDDYRPGLKPIEKVVSFYDYSACGISVLAPLAAAGDPEALRLLRIVQQNMDHYRRSIHNRDVPGWGVWKVPLRRLILHVALAYRALEHVLDPAEKQRYRELVEEQVALAIEHNRGFLPGRTDLHVAGGVNNHTAIFMQGIYY